MRSIAKLGLVLIASAPGVAKAADLSVPAAPPLLTAAPAANWHGFYAGSFISGSTTRFESRQAASRSVDKGGHATGILAGYNFQTGAYVFGIEGDISKNFVRARNEGAAGLVAHELESLHSIHFRARLGYDLGAFLPFVAGGVTLGEAAVRAPFGLNDYKGDVRTRAGWNIGAGVDWRVALPIIGQTVLRAEYVYDRLPYADFRYDPALAPIGMKSSSHQIRAALIYTPSLRGWRAPQFDAADWSGAYAGVLAGYGDASLRTQTSNASEKLDADGGLGGLYAGRNFVFGQLVVGWEGATMLSAWKGDGVVPGRAPNAHSYRGYFETDIRGRVGYAFGRFLPFVAAGASFGRSEQSDRQTLSHRAKITNDAWTVGAGLDYMLMERVSARIEYLRQKSWKDSDVDLNGVSMKQSRDADVVRAGFAWHFH